jgi:membrane associated rhomboid family serine protease
VIPLSDHNPTSRKPLLVPLLIAANVIIFFFVQPSFAGSDQQGQIEQFRFNLCKASIPYEVMHQEPLARAEPSEIDFGNEFDNQQIIALANQDCPGKSVWLSILASLFFHGGLLHLGGNMLFLWVFGNNIEDRLGIGKFALFYLLSGIAATFAQSIFSANSAIPLIGASGAIAGVLGAYLLLYPRARVRTLVIFVFITILELPAALVLGLWFVLQLFQGAGPGAVSDNVAYLAHVGGFLAGMALLLVLRPSPRPAAGSWRGFD